MAQGLFVTLIIGTIIQQIGSFVGGSYGDLIYLVGKVAAALTGRAGRKSTIVMDGGELEIEWNENDNHVYKTGPATFVFDGEVELP